MVAMRTVRLGDHAKLIRGITFKPGDKCDPRDEGAVICMRTKNVQETLDASDVIAVPSGSREESREDALHGRHPRLKCEQLEPCRQVLPSARATVSEYRGRLHLDSEADDREAGVQLPVSLVFLGSGTEETALLCKPDDEHLEP